MFGLVAMAIGISAVACSAPAKSTNSTNSDPAVTTTTVADPGTGPTSITRTFRTTEVAQGFGPTTNIVARPMRNQLWVTEKSGTVRAIEIQTRWNEELGQTQRNGFKTYPGPIVNISGDLSTEGERGLLGIAFSTDAQTLFLSYVNRSGELVIASWKVTDPIPPPVTVPSTVAPSSTVPGAPPTTAARTTTTSVPKEPEILPTPVVDPSSKRVLLSIPRSGTSNYSGQLVLGRDGFLYIGVGDAPDGAAERTAQNTESLLGKILRIDPGGATFTSAYSIPPGNPYATGGGAPPIWSIGAQNPLRFSFDRANGNLWVGDAGHVRFGEIDYLPVSSGAGSGANLGWPYKDGKEVGPTTEGAPSKLVTPLVVIPATGVDCPIIGGYVYRGSVTEMQGVYIYGDRCSGTVKGLLQRKGIVLDDKAIGPQLGSNSIVAFAEDSQGELYIVTTAGTVQRLIG